MSKRSHRIMIWCGIIIFPAFGILDYMTLEQWPTFLTVRFCGAAILAALLLLDNRFTLRSETMAHVSSQVVINSLMWMLSQIDDPEVFSIYAINSCTGFIASAIFLLWRPVNSVILFAGTLLGFVVFHMLFSELTWFCIIMYGTLPLFTIALMSQLYVHYHYQMVTRDFQTQEYLNSVNSDLQNKNCQIEQQSQKIEKQNEKLKEANEIKDRLFMIISHDFKGPLQSMKGVLDLLHRSTSISPEEFVMITNGIRMKVDATYDFLESLLVWSKSQMKGFQIKPVNLTAYDLAEGSIGLLRGIAVQKSIRLLNETSPDHVIVADEDMMRLIIRNLLSNAIKFSHEDSCVTVRSEVNDEEQIIFSISDTGVGMNEEEVNTLFSNHGYFSKKGTSNESGTGLGLKLVKEFVVKNRGKLWVESEPGKGSTFRFTLPAGKIPELMPG